MVCADNTVVIPMRACDRGKSEARGARRAEGAPCEDRFVGHVESSALTDPFCSRSHRPCLNGPLDCIRVDYICVRPPYPRRLHIRVRPPHPRRLHPRVPTTFGPHPYILQSRHFYAACVMETCAHTSPPRNLRSASHLRHIDLCVRLLQAVRRAT